MTSWMLQLDSTQVLAARIAFGATTGNLSDFVQRRMGVVFSVDLALKLVI